MGLIGTILYVLVILVVLWYLISWLFGKRNNLGADMASGLVAQYVDGKDLPTSSDQTSNYTISTWFYVSDWNINYGQEKTLLNKGESSPSIVLGATSNDITVTQRCFPSAGGERIEHQCVIQNFPLQKWVNLIVSLYGRTMDIYVDGKLVRTCVLPGVADVSGPNNIHITPNGGFDGFVTNTQYWAQASNPQDAYNIYKDGFGSNWLSSLINKYRVRFTFLEDNREITSFEI